MRITPAMKVFMYLLTMAKDKRVLTQPVWADRYHLNPKRTAMRLVKGRYIVELPGGDSFALTTKGQQALNDIAQWLWIHEYYLPGVIDFKTLWHPFWMHQEIDYPLLLSLLKKAMIQHREDSAYVAILLRHQLKLAFDTHHDQEAMQTLMALIYQDLHTDGKANLTAFNYQTSWAKITRFEIQMLGELLSRLDWNLGDFEMQFSAWLNQQPCSGMLFTRFEVMTIVMYEIAGNVKALTRLYQDAARRYQLHQTPQVLEDNLLSS